MANHLIVNGGGDLLKVDGSNLLVVDTILPSSIPVALGIAMAVALVHVILHRQPQICTVT